MPFVLTIPFPNGPPSPTAAAVHAVLGFRCSVIFLLSLLQYLPFSNLLLLGLLPPSKPTHTHTSSSGRRPRLLFGCGQLDQSVGRFGILWPFCGSTVPVAAGRKLLARGIFGCPMLCSTQRISAKSSSLSATPFRWITP